MSSIEAVISDFGGVLTSPLMDAFTAIQENHGLDLGDLGRAMQLVKGSDGYHPLYELEKGKITEAEFIKKLDDALANLGSAVSLHGFRESYFDALHPNVAMIDLMHELRAAGYKMALLTNNVREWEPVWRAKLPVDDIFHTVVDSAFVGMRKPESGIYELTLKQLGLQAERCLFVDDVEVNCSAAENLGFNVVHFRNTNQAIGDIRGALHKRTENRSDSA